MLTSERHAKTLWCPFARVLWGEEDQNIAITAVNRTDKLVKYSNCFGSGCMAWQWDGDASKEGADDLGWCGLAAKPRLARPIE